MCDAVFRVFLGVGRDGLRRGLEREQRAGREKFFREFARVDAGDFFQALQNFRSRARVVVGEVRFSVSETSPASSRPAMPAWATPRSPEKTVRHNRAGRADRFVAEKYRLLRRQRAEPVMVNDLNNLHLVRARTACDSSL